MIKRTLVLAIGALAAVAVLGCGSDDSSGSTGGSAGSSAGGAASTASAPLSCNYDDEKDCTYYSTAEPSQTSLLCPSPGAVVTACATTDLIGTCTFTSSGVDEEYFYYKGNTTSVATLQSGCTMLMGTFSN